MSDQTKTNEKLLFVLNRLSGMSPYFHRFDENSQDPQMLSGFVSAMGNFMGEVSGEDQDRWKTVFGPDSTLLAEGGDWCMGVLVVSRETSEGRSKLRAIVSEFEDSFQNLKNSDCYEGSAFRDFDSYVRRVFYGDRISSKTLLRGRINPEHPIKTFYKPSITFKMHKLLYDLREPITVEDLADRKNMHLDEVKDLVSLAVWSQLIHVSFVPDDDDILSLSEGSPTVLFSHDSSIDVSPDVLQVLGMLDGVTRLGDILSGSRTSVRQETRTGLGTLIDQGFVQRVPIEQRLLLANQCVLSLLAQNGARAMGDPEVAKLLHNSRTSGLSEHRWLAFIQIKWNHSVHLNIPASLTHTEFDEFHEAVDFMIGQVMKGISEKIGPREANKILLSARETCYRRWSAHVFDVIY